MFIALFIPNFLNISSRFHPYPFYYYASHPISSPALLNPLLGVHHVKEDEPFDSNSNKHPLPAKTAS
jgi:hypothetical protein